MRIKQILLSAAAGAAMLLGSMAAQAIVGPIPRPPGPTPVGYAYRWVPPVYRTVTDRSWVGERIERVMQWTEISPGRWANVLCDVLVPGHWEATTRQVQVSGGYWQLVAVDPMPPPVIVPLPRPVDMRGGGTVGVDGYGSGGGEDLSKFSGLSAWPDKK